MRTLLDTSVAKERVRKVKEHSKNYSADTSYRRRRTRSPEWKHSGTDSICPSYHHHIINAAMCGVLREPVPGPLLRGPGTGSPAATRPSTATTGPRPGATRPTVSPPINCRPDPN
jgi:hypothetical protein